MSLYSTVASANKSQEYLDRSALRTNTHAASETKKSNEKHHLNICNPIPGKHLQLFTCVT